MNVINHIKDLEKKKTALQKEVDKLTPKFVEVEQRYLQACTALQMVTNTLESVEAAVLGVATALEKNPGISPLDGKPSTSNRKKAAVMTIRQEIVEFLRENPMSTATKVKKNLEYSGAYAYLSMLVKDKKEILRTRKTPESNWLYYIQE